MADVRLYLVASNGPQRLPLLPTELNLPVHELFDELPLGVYTSMRTFDHDKFLSLPAHLERLAESMAFMGWSFKLDQRGLCRALHQACHDYPNPDSRVRIDVLASAPTRWGLAAKGDSGRVLLALAPFEPIPASCYRNGVATSTVAALKRQLPQAKRADFVVARRAYAAADQRYFERFLLSDDGLILEGVSSNFFAVHDGTIYTANSGILLGTARRIVIKVAADLAVPVAWQAWPLEKLDALEGAFLSSSSRGIVPVVSIDDQQIGNGSPDATTRSLMAAYNEYVRQNIQSATALLD